MHRSWFFALLLPLVAAAQEYTISTQGNPAGALVVQTDAVDGQTRVRATYSYRNNGRGPDIEEEFRFDAAGVPVRYQVRGKATFGAEIREDFRLEGGRLVWSSPVDSGDEPAADGTLFVPLENTPAHSAQLWRALLARPDRKAPGPGGSTLAIERLAQLQVQGTPVALYAVTGGASEPWYLWLRDDASQALFALVWPGWHLVARGYEASGEMLVERQRQAQLERLQALQQRLRQPLPGLTLIRGVRWFDSRAARMRGPSDIYLHDGRIAAITAPDALRAQPQQTIEGQGRTLLPGLYDMHAHLWPAAGLQHLAGGVTSVRDLANQNHDLALLKQRIDEQQIAGPHVHPAGLIEGKSPFALRSGIVAADEREALAAVDWYAARGFRQLKLYNSIKPAWVPAITARARAHGMTVAGHVPAFMRAEDAVRAGYDELTHINQLMLNFFVQPSQDTRTLLRFTLVGEKAREVRADGAAARRFIALLKARKVAVDPTLATFEAMFTQRDGEPNPSLGMIADHLPVLWRRGLRASEMSPTEDQARRYRESWARMLDLTVQMHRAGITLVAGTDATPGLMLHRELELYVQAGIPPLEALKIATWNGAKIAGVLAESGSIERGKRADLVLVDGDPSRRISDIRKASLVFKAGVAYAPAQLHEALGIKPFAPAAAIERVVNRP